MDSIVLPPALRIANAQSFIDSLGTSNYYVGLGKVSPWTPTDLSPSANDTNPPIATTSVDYINSVWKNAFGLKRLSSNNASLAIPRYNWTSGTIYDQYDSSDSELYTKTFYVMTSTFDVFKCVFNNNGGIATIEPTTSNLNTSDGYRWKYMYSVSLYEQNKFLMDDYIPVSKLSSTPNNGEIMSIDVVDGGSGYTTASVTINGDGTGAACNATIVSGVITKINVTSFGEGYTSATITITGDGTGASARANVSPLGGHGFDVTNELFSFYVILSVQTNYDESGKFIVGNDFRQVFIVKDPVVYETNTISNLSEANLTTIIEVSDTSSFSLDQEIVIRDGSTDIGSAIVAHIDSGNNYLYLTNITSPEIQSTYVLFDGVGSNSIVNITYPDIKPSGNIILILNKEPTTRNILQTETFKIPLEW